MANDTSFLDSSLIKVLLVEDDEDDFIITRDLFSEMRGRRFTLDWEKTFELGLRAMTINQHDVCLVDYRLGARNGVDLLRAAWKQPARRFERGYGWMFSRHIKQANEGCDFDFLETGFGAPVGEPPIY